MSTQTDMSNNYRAFLLLMQSVLNETNVQLPDVSVNWQALYDISLKHSLAGMLYYAIEKLPEADRPQGEFMQYLAQMYREHIVADLNISFETERMLNILSSKGVRCLPVKGIVTKADYPVEHLRSMVDVDILCDPENRLEIERTFLKNGYEKETVGEKDTGYRKDEILHYEMHNTLVIKESPAYDYFAKIWDRVTYSDNSKIAKMNLEDTYIFMLEHIADHLVFGGAGIRMYIDVYLFLKKHGDSIDRKYVDKILTEIKLKDFEIQTVKICNNWFSGTEEIDCDSLNVRFILDSTTFGRTKVSLLSDIIRNEDNSSALSNGVKRILRKLFPKLSWMKYRFRAVDKIPFLYIFFIPVHWVDRLIIKGNVETKNIGNYFVSASSEDAKKLRETFVSLGLEKRL